MKTAAVDADIVHPLDAPLGAEIVGLDLADEPHGDTVFSILSAFRDYSVLVFRDQTLNDERLVEISEWFGPRYLPPPGVPMAGGPDQPRVVEISNRDGGVGVVGPLPAHSDLQYMPVPAAATMLYAVEVPPVGGDTCFANLQRAFKELPPATQQRLSRLKGLVRNPFTGAGYGRTMSGEHQYYINNEVPDCPHPLVRTHPDTGRRSLYFSPFVERIIGDITPDEESALLAALKAHVDQSHLYYVHQWRAGDLLVWDNRCTNHKREAFDVSIPRVMHRLEIAGTRPF